MSKGIILSPKHGVNPCIPVCFFCGEEKNELAFLGKLPARDGDSDPEAPKHLVLDYEPCDKCKEKFSKGVLIIEVVPYAEDRPSIQKDAYPTGNYAVVKPEALTNGAKAGSMALMYADEFQEIFRKPEE